MGLRAAARNCGCQTFCAAVAQACHVDAAWQLVAEKAGELLAARRK